MIIHQTLEKFLPTHKTYTSPKNFNGELGMPLSIFKIEEWQPKLWYFVWTIYHALDLLLWSSKPYDIIVLEYGVDHPGEMDFLLSIVKPDIGIFTAIDAVHSEQFGNPERIAQDESAMVLACTEKVFLNAQDSYATKLMERPTVDTLLYQTQWHDNARTHIWSENELFVWDEHEMYVTFDMHIKNKKIQVQTNVFGKAHYGYVWVAFAIADMIAHKWSGTTITGFMQGIVMDYNLQAGRLWVFAWHNDSVIVDSSYNASPLSIRTVIDTVHVMRKQLLSDYKVWLVLWDMRELGELTEREHRLLAGYVHQSADEVFLVGEYMKAYLYDELDKIGYDMSHVQWFSKSTKCGDTIRQLLQSTEDKVILIFKWSQNTIFLEEAIKHVLYDPSDIKKLVRQWYDREQAKRAFFGSDF